VRASVLQTFTAQWLVPRLPGLQAAHPTLRLLLSTGMRPVDLRTEPFDCAVRWGRGGWGEDLEHTLLVPEAWSSQPVRACTTARRATRCGRFRDCSRCRAPTTGRTSGWTSRRVAWQGARMGGP
jgi:DNA-binding transcriptional LysR family regulator